MKHFLDDVVRQCTTDKFSQKIEEKIIEKFGNISTEPIFADEITEDSLEIANSIAFKIFFCSFNVELLRFYQKLFKNFSLETVLKVLGRILSVTKEKSLLTPHYNLAKALFDKTTILMDLESKDIAVLTTAASELEQYPGLKNHQVNKEISRSKNRVKFLNENSDFSQISKESSTTLFIFRMKRQHPP